MEQQSVWVTNTAAAASPRLQAGKSSDNVLQFSLTNYNDLALKITGTEV